MQFNNSLKINQKNVNEHQEKILLLANYFSFQMQTATNSSNFMHLPSILYKKGKLSADLPGTRSRSFIGRMP